MPDKIRHEQFEVCLEEIFTLSGESESLELRLIEVNLLTDTPLDTSPRLPFSLLFRGPQEPLMQQRIYRLSNPRLNEVELFLVPVGPDAEGMRYEAILN